MKLSFAPLTRGYSKEVALFLLCLLCGTSLSVLLIPGTATQPKELKAKATLLGLELEPGELGLEQAESKLQDFSRGRFQLYLPDGSYEVFDLRELELRINRPRLKSLLIDTADPFSITTRQWRKKGDLLASQKEKTDTAKSPQQRRLNLPLPLEVSTAASTALLLRLKDTLDQAPADARINLKTKQIVKHIRGRSLDIDATARSINEAIEKGEKRSNAAFHFIEPKRQSQDLQGLKFNYVLGSFTTKYSRTRKAQDRTFNLRIAASRLDGTVLLPGQIFDFNRVVGPRDEAHGYRVATVIANGELVDGIGGGTCQISGTLHGAAFFAGLEIVERYPHTRPSSYIKMGMDATVVYPTINFRVKNSFDFPVVLSEVVEDGAVTAQVLGAQVDQVVTLIRKIDQAITYEEQERPDARLPRGKKVLTQRGIPGFRLHRYRIRRSGAHTTREKWKDLYPPTPQIVRVGTGPLLASGRTNSGTPEYLADELLVITQKRPRAEQSPELVENREAGRFGQAGWTQEAGMPFWSKTR